jgi:rare lipoprotein A (peptidoglycan hydrolase)
MTFISTLGYNLYLRVPQSLVPSLAKALVWGTFSAMGVLPTSAFAFELELPDTVSEALPSPLDFDEVLASDEDQLSEEMIRSYSAGVAIARPSTITEVGKWSKPPKRKALAFPSAPRNQQPAPSTGDAVLALEGEASYYSRAGCLGCNPLRIMANGQPLDDSALTMAIGADKKHLVGRLAKVTNLATGQAATVRITDTGGFYQAKYGNRVADLTIATKQAIGIQGGLGTVRVEVY